MGQRGPKWRGLERHAHRLRKACYSQKFGNAIEEIAMSRLVLLGASLVALLLTGCGLKYDLYLPDDETQAVEQNQGSAIGADTSARD